MDSSVSSSPAAAAMLRISNRKAAISAQRAALDDEERQLNRLWNSYLHVNRLPAELLVQVFVSCSRSGATSIALRWRKFRLVCGHWNEIVCGTPSLWRAIDACMHPSWLSLCLTRSIPATIDITIDPSKGHALEWFLTLLQPHAIRMRSLIVDGDVSETSLDSIALLLHHSSSALEIVRVTPPLPQATQLAISHLRHPRIHNLYLQGICRPVDAQLMSGLRSLSLHTCYQAFLVVEFLDVIASSHRLEELVLIAFLHGLVGDLHDPSLSYRKPINLPRLVSLRLIDHTPAVTSTFISHLRLSAQVDIELSSPSLETTQEGYTDTLSALLPPAPLRTATSPLISSSTIKEVSLSTIAMCYELETTKEDASHGSLLLRITFPGHMRQHESQVFKRGLSDLLDIVSGAPLTRLSVVGYTRSEAPTVSVWTRLFTTFPALESLTLVLVGHMPSFWDALGGGTGGTGPENAPMQYPVRYLSRLELSVALVVSNGLFDRIIDCLGRRGEQGLRLGFLKLGKMQGWQDRDDEVYAREIHIPRIRTLVEELRLPSTWSDPTI